MKKLAWQSALFAAVLVLFYIVFRLQDNTFTAYIPIHDPSQDMSQLQMVQDMDGEEEAQRGGLTFEPPVPRGNYAEVRMKPGRRGDVWARVQDGAGNDISLGGYHVGLFGTVYDYNTGGFTGDWVVLILMVIFFLGESILLFLAFRRAKGAAFYAYSTIYLAGFSLFMLLTGITFAFGAAHHMRNPSEFPMMSVYARISSAGYQFLLVTIPFIVLFACAMTISNIELLRHERRRIQNVLGILISVIMVAGAALAVFMYTRNFSGSETQYRIRLTLMNAYTTVYIYFECMLIGAIICGVVAAKHIPQGACRYIIILGCGFRKDGSLPPLLRGRVDRAISFWRQQKENGVDAILIPSGGQGRNESMAEAEAMRRYIVEQEIPPECILLENQSANTYQNMEFSKKLIEEHGAGPKVVFSTTNYHVFRSGVWASLAGLEAEGIGSHTKWWFWPNAFVRECVGLLVNRWKQELLFLIILLVLFGALSMAG